MVDIGHRRICLFWSATASPLPSSPAALPRFEQYRQICSQRLHAKAWQAGVDEHVVLATWLVHSPLPGGFANHSPGYPGIGRRSGVVADAGGADAGTGKPRVPAGRCSNAVASVMRPCAQHRPLLRHGGRVSTANAGRRRNSRGKAKCMKSREDRDGSRGRRGRGVVPDAFRRSDPVAEREGDSRRR